MAKRRAEIFKVLGVESRLKIIELLKSKGPLCVNELADLLGISQSAVSQHLKVLKFAGLVNDERQGYWIPYDINPQALEKCGETLAVVCSCECCEPDRGRDPQNDDEGRKLEMLEQYARELKEQLKRVQARIGELKNEDE